MDVLRASSHHLAVQHFAPCTLLELQEHVTASALHSASCITLQEHMTAHCVHAALYYH